MTSKKLYQPDEWHFGLFKSRSGAIVRYGSAEPDQSPARGTVVLTGGYDRYIEHYYEAINNWRDRGYKVWAMDWDGQGGSSREDPHRPHKPSGKSFEHQAAIFDEFVTQIVQPDRSKPAYLCSHSMGGNIIMRYVAAHQDRADFPFTAMILAAPMIDINTYVVSRTQAKIFINAAHALGMDDLIPPKGTKLFRDFRKSSLFNSNDLDPDRQTARDYYRYHTMHNRIGYPTASWLRNAFNSSDIVNQRRFFNSLKLPALIITPGQDNLVSIHAQTRAARYMHNARQVKIDQARHGVWYDCDDVQRKLWHEIDYFIKQRESPQPRLPPPGP